MPSLRLRRFDRSSGGTEKTERHSRFFLEMSPRFAETTGKKYHEISVPWQFMEANPGRILENFNLKSVQTLDLFDPRADLVHDMNQPLPAELKARYATVIDIGCLEHVFDTKQCLQNLFHLLTVGGRLMLHTPCSGYFDHGFYTFSPESILESLRSNGFEIEYVAFSLEPEGFKLEKPIPGEDVLLWCVARKVREESRFIIPQQKGCGRMYLSGQHFEGPGRGR